MIQSRLCLLTAGLLVLTCGIFGCGGGGGGGGTAAPTTPTNLQTPTVSSTSVTLTWTDNSTNETGFEVQRQRVTAPAVDWATVTVTAAGVSSYTDSGLSAGVTYNYRVRAVGTGGNSSWLGPVSVTTSTVSVPAAPSNFRVTGSTSLSVTLAWQDNSTNETGFEIQRRPSSGSWTLLATTAPNATTYTDGIVVTGVTYEYQIRATGSAGNSAWVGPVTATPTAVGTVTGRILSLLSGLPLSSATVSIGSNSVTTGSDGAFTLSNIPAGAQTIKVTAASYDDLSVPFTVAEGTNNVGDLAMTPSGGGPPPPPF
jgi:hypothetical protein